MRIAFRSAALALGLSTLAAPASPLFAQDGGEPAREEGHGWGIAIGAAASASPLGEIAERHGTYGVPGRQVEARVFRRTPEGRTWSLALIEDAYHIGQQLDRSTSYAFDYDSRSLVVGYEQGIDAGDMRLVQGVDVGWVRFAAAANMVNYYTGEPERSRTTGDAAVVAFTAGVEIPGAAFAAVPRLRLEANFPDFGGGDGYSGLHRETDAGFKASVGISLRLVDLF